MTIHFAIVASSTLVTLTYSGAECLNSSRWSASSCIFLRCWQMRHYFWFNLHLAADKAEVVAWQRREGGNCSGKRFDRVWLSRCQGCIITLGRQSSAWVDNSVYWLPFWRKTNIAHVIGCGVGRRRRRERESRLTWAASWQCCPTQPNYAACYDLFMSAADKRLDLDELAQSAASSKPKLRMRIPNPHLNLKLKISIREVN